MHFRFVIRQLGLLLLVLSLAMVFATAWAIYDARSGHSEIAGTTEAVRAFLWSMGIGVAGGAALIAVGRGGGGQLGRREALLLVALSWFVGAGLAALPFRLWAAFHTIGDGQDAAFGSLVNCYFEAMSGLTTTGATVLADIPTIPHALLFWRAFTHWLGGLGIVVLFVAVLPLLGVGGKRLFKVEATGPTTEGVTPRIQETARLLWFIYLGLTALEIALLMLVDDTLTWFEAITHTFATLATGGFSTMNSSAGGFGPGVQWVLILFMLLAGVNFGIYHQIISGKWKPALRNTELRAYLLILLVAAVFVAWNIHGTWYDDTTGASTEHTGLGAVRDAVFQVVSIQTTTGFCTANFDQWNFFAKAILIVLMFIGGCGGSTGGGIKVIRIVVAVKVMLAELERAFRPNVVRPVRIGSAMVDDQQRLGILAYILGIIFLFVIGTLLLMGTESASEIDSITAMTAAVATLNNIGPGLARVGAVENYAWFSDAGKLVMCVLMAVGRLEVFAILVIFVPRFWRTH